MQGLLDPDPVIYGYQLLYQRGQLSPPRLKIDMRAVEQMPLRRQLEVQAMLQEWEVKRRTDPIAFYDAASAKHVCVHASAKKIRCVFGGNRAGKSTIGQIDSIVQAMPWGLVPEHVAWFKRYDCELQGPFKQRTVVNDMKRTGAVVRDKWREWVPKSLLKQGSFDRSYDKNNDVLTLECGCMFEILSTEMDLDKHGGHARHRIVYDEEPPQAYRVENVQRLIDFDGDEIFAMTPLKGLSWAYHDLWKQRGTEFIDAWSIGMRDNKNLSEKAIRFALSQITNEAERRQREFGVFAERGGAIYPSFFDRRRRAPTKDELRYLHHRVSIDPGIRNAGIVFGATDRDGRGLIYAALKLKNQDAGDYAREIRRVLATWEIKLDDVDFVIDPSARNRSLTNSESVEGVLNRHGIYCDPGQNDVEAGIHDVSIRIKQGGIFFSEQLHALFDEAIEYSWEERDDGQSVPRKVNDHLMDALRYWCMQDPWEPIDTSSKLWVPPGSDLAYPPARREPAGSVLGDDS